MGVSGTQRAGFQWRRLEGEPLIWSGSVSSEGIAVKSFASRIWTAKTLEAYERRTSTSDGGDAGCRASGGKAQKGQRSQVLV